MVKPPKEGLKSSAPTQTGAWSGTADQQRLDDCDDSETDEQRQSDNLSTATGLRAFHLLQIICYSQEYQSHTRNEAEIQDTEKKRRQFMLLLQ